MLILFLVESELLLSACIYIILLCRLKISKFQQKKAAMNKDVYLGGTSIEIILILDSLRVYQRIQNKKKYVNPTIQSVIQCL